MNILSIDVGIKNCAYVLLNIDESNNFNTKLCNVNSSKGRDHSGFKTYITLIYVWFLLQASKSENILGILIS